ncbi:(Fe-S)-binding protein [Peptostreptococcus faecalis]|uniref:(Fe-S)-binding protein n=1 Tax=Peptostreptococcus faecalis TaxID=2045015 RepID=UPI000C7D8FE3|nr:(Fe-S)-binding protein [Peptostreptococcus faecalis]
MKKVFAPGCSLILYKPELVNKSMDFLVNYIDKDIEEHIICCKHDPKLEENTKIINACPGCDQRYRSLYKGISTISLWEILADNNNFIFPDYNGIEMSIHDACSTRTEDRVHDSVRKLLEKMNIKVVEPKNTRKKSTCCGGSFYGSLSEKQVHERMRSRASEMQKDDVVTYCLGCVSSMAIGGKKPRYILDLLFNENTTTDELTSDSWQEKVNNYIEKH